MVRSTAPEPCAEALAYGSQRWPDSVEAHRGLAFCLSLLGRHAEALSAARRCLAPSPAHTPCLGSMGTTLWHLGRRAEGREYLERVVAAQIAEG